MCAVTELQDETIAAAESMSAIMELKPGVRANRELTPARVRPSGPEVKREWMRLMFETERLSGEVRRGRECIEEFKQHAAELRNQLEDWVDYEKVCGHNPLPDYAQALLATERVLEFLTGWVKKRSVRLAFLTAKLEESSGRVAVRQRR